MPKCIICGKEVDKTYGDSNLAGVYYRDCAIENGYTTEQLMVNNLSKDCQHIEHKSQKNAQKVEFGIKQCEKCEYYLRCEECCIDYDKKELIKLKQQLAITEKALELLAQEYICYTDEVDITVIIDSFIMEAKEILGNE